MAVPPGRPDEIHRRPAGGGGGAAAWLRAHRRAGNNGLREPVHHGQHCGDIRPDRHGQRDDHAGRGGQGEHYGRVLRAFTTHTRAFDAHLPRQRPAHIHKNDRAGEAVQHSGGGGHVLGRRV